MKKCTFCHKGFIGHSKEQGFCSYKCSNGSRKKRVLWKCELCNYTEEKIKCRALASKYCKICCKGARYKGKLNGNWKGGYKYCNGYKLIYKPEHLNAKKNYVSEHRYVMEKYLKRLLKQEEQVHHINMIKDDNRIENLRLYSSNSEHIKNEHMEITKKAQQGRREAICKSR